MPKIVSQCPLCGGSLHKRFETVTFRGLTVSNQICTLCGFVFQSPRMTADELDAFYADEYRQLYQGEEGPSPKDLHVQNLRAISLLKFTRGTVPKVNRHLDIGCSAGILLNTFHDHFNCESVGVEPGNAYRRYGQKRGLDVYPSLESLASTGAQPFDLISMAHVLEHFPDPVESLASLRESHLTLGGWLLIEVPNLYCHDSFETAHLTSFSAHTLCQTVQQAGFETVKLRRHGYPRSKVLPLYLTLLARPMEGPLPPVRPERGVPLKRRLGIFVRRAIERLTPSLAWVPWQEDGVQP